MSGWATHPLFGATTREAAAASLDVLPDGMIALAPDGLVESMNLEAARLLGLPSPATGAAPGALAVDLPGWEAITEAVAAGRRGDLPLRGADGQSVLATLARGPDGTEIRWILLRDVQSFTVRADRSFDRPSAGNVRFLSAERTRPDFAAQRRLCPEINRLLSRGERAMRQGARVLLTGESGVGKSEIARFLHATVADAHDPFVVVNCASLSGAQLDALLFGDGGGDGPGLIAGTSGATVFLDEVGELPPAIQARLLGFLEDGPQKPLPGPAGRGRAAHVISATNRDLRTLVAEGRFRADLYFRLCVINLHVPPLRALGPLVDHLVDRFVQTINRRRQTPVIVPKRLRDVLADYSFPGNIRELHNIVQRITIFVDDAEGLDDLIAELIVPVDIGGTSPGSAEVPPTMDLRTEVRRFERALIDKAIRIHGSKRKAAHALGVNIGTIVRKTTGDDGDDTGNDHANEELAR